MKRSENRAANEIRNVKITRNFTKNAEGSVLYQAGNTWVICTASIQDRVPSFLRGSGKGWVTAEYGMLPRSTNSRMNREAARGKQGGRTLEIQRLIGRSLRSVVDLDLLGECSIIIDCDVIQADGGTRTASISGGYVALVDAIKKADTIADEVITGQVAAISAGIVCGEAALDLDYKEDSSADTDMNVVMMPGGKIVEVQGTAENKAFSLEELNSMLKLSQKGIDEILSVQQEVLNG